LVLCDPSTKSTQPGRSSVGKCTVHERTGTRQDALAPYPWSGSVIRCLAEDLGNALMYVYIVAGKRLNFYTINITDVAIDS